MSTFRMIDHAIPIAIGCITASIITGILASIDWWKRQKAKPSPTETEEKR